MEEKLGNTLTLVLKRHFKTVHRQLFPTRRSVLMKMQHMRIMMWVNLSQSTEWAEERAEQYVGKFMANAGFTARYGRHVGISEDIHERVTKFVSIVGKGKISIASYVDNIINEHFNAYAAEIKAAFDEGLKSYRL